MKTSFNPTRAHLATVALTAADAPSRGPVLSTCDAISLLAKQPFLMGLAVRFLDSSTKCAPAGAWGRLEA
jgi:hypothetical protein